MEKCVTIGKRSSLQKVRKFFIQGEANIAIQLIKPEEMDTDGNQE